MPQTVPDAPDLPDLRILRFPWEEKLIFRPLNLKTLEYLETLIPDGEWKSTDLLVYFTEAIELTDVLIESDVYLEFYKDDYYEWNESI
jgi:hypothetical protein